VRNNEMEELNSTGFIGIKDTNWGNVYEED